MPASERSRAERLRSSYQAAGQGQVFTFWESLDERERSELLDDLEGVNTAELSALSAMAASTDHRHPTAEIEPAEVVSWQDVSNETIELGRQALAKGSVAALTVAGGQGTRLGLDGPKGALPISPVRGKTLFQLFAEFIAATDRRYGCATTWYVMTSPANDAQTRAFFAANQYFGLSSERIRFFKQGVMPAFDPGGKILLDQPHRLALSPDGHGGTLLALAHGGMLADMVARGVEQISYFQVDNPLVACLDPAFIGLHVSAGAEMSSKSVPKADDLEKVGNFVRVNGKAAVIEYSDLPPTLGHAKNPDGTRRFNAANIAVHLLSRRFVERLTENPASFALPWHRAEKKVPYMDLSSGRRVHPERPNAIKLESFIFDALPLANRTVTLETSREEEFSPVKNPTGVDSIETAQRDMSRRAARWMASAGYAIPRRADGEPDGRFEISPLVALDATQLTEQPRPARSISAGESVYLG
ncbi:MAG TPA: UDPGP type 1 family protein [Phycisphaerae bacterium]|nr:UDPGP type 1 family protein [Phycisphaerae bacterium]